MKNKYWIIFLFIYASCTSPLKQNFIKKNQVEVFKISKQYCFENGLCTNYITHRVDAGSYSIDSIVSMDLQYIDSFEIERIKKIDVSKNKDQDIIDKFLKGWEISRDYKKENGARRFVLLPDWFFGKMKFSKDEIKGNIIGGENEEYFFQINNLEKIQSFDFQIKNTSLLSGNKIQVFTADDNDFSMIFDFDFFKKYGMLYFGDLSIENLAPASTFPAN